MRVEVGKGAVFAGSDAEIPRLGSALTPATYVWGFARARAFPFGYLRR